MSLLRTALLRARPQIVVVSQNPKLLRVTNGTPSSLSKSFHHGRSVWTPQVSSLQKVQRKSLIRDIVSPGKFQYGKETPLQRILPLVFLPYRGQYLLIMLDHSTHIDHICSQARTTREDSNVNPGTEFTYFKVHPHLIPRGWTNDPQELEVCIGLNLHKEYTSLPPVCRPILSFKGNSGYLEYLVRAEDEIYLISTIDHVFRLETSADLARLLECVREQADKKGESAFGPTVLDHPKLDWYRLEEDEWTVERYWRRLGRNTQSCG